MSVLSQSWSAEANALGYENEREMLKNLYEDREMSFSEIAHVLGYSLASVRKRVIAYGIGTRKRGGPNFFGRRKLKAVPSEELEKTSPKVLAEKYRVHIATVFKEKRERAKMEAAQEVAQ